jgi:hypothetical protein
LQAIPAKARNHQKARVIKIVCVEKWTCSQPRRCAEGPDGIAAAKDSDDARYGRQGREGCLIFDDDDAAKRGGCRRPNGTVRKLCDRQGEARPPRVASVRRAQVPYDLASDPRQMQPVSAPDIEADFCRAIVSEMKAHDASEELYARFQLADLAAS